jgi:hypothetical protein
MAGYHGGRHDGVRVAPIEYTRVEGQPLPAKRLAELWWSLDERERLGFMHSLAEPLADELIDLVGWQAQEQKGQRS